MNPIVQSWVFTIVAALIATLVYQTHYIDKAIEGLRNELKAEIAGLRAEMNHRFDDLVRYIDQRFKNVEERLDRLEHAVTRP